MGVGEATQGWDLHSVLMEGFNVALNVRKGIKDKPLLIPETAKPQGNFKMGLFWQ